MGDLISVSLPRKEREKNEDRDPHSSISYQPEHAELSPRATAAVVGDCEPDIEIISKVKSWLSQINLINTDPVPS